MSTSSPRALTSGIPGRPPRVARVVALNVDGAAEPGPLGELDASCLAKIIGHICVVDARPEDRFDSGHIAGAINVPAAGRWPARVSAGRPTENEPIVVVADRATRPCGFADLPLCGPESESCSGSRSPTRPTWINADIPVRRATVLPPQRVAGGLASGEYQLVDVRDAAEWSADHVEGSINLPLSVLADGRRVELDDERPSPSRA